MLSPCASGIAAAAARRFAAEGARVQVFSLDSDEAEDVASDLAARGAETFWTAVDLTDGDATEAAFATGRSRFGRLDGLFAVAGGSGRRFGDGPLHEATTEGWRTTMDLNGLPAFHAARAAVRIMLDEPGPGSIVPISSVLATDPSPRLFATHSYAAAKGGALSLGKAAACYYAPNGIRFNAIAPGLVDTPMAARAGTSAAMTPRPPSTRRSITAAGPRSA